MRPSVDGAASLKDAPQPPAPNPGVDPIGHWILSFALTFAFLLSLPDPIWAQATLSQNVLVVYNSADSSSTAVADYYIARRGIPAQNLCPITPPAITYLQWTDFVSSVQSPIQKCLNQSLNQIFYIVFTYNTPYTVIAPDRASYSLDQFVADIWDVYTPPGQYGNPGRAQPYYADAQSQGNVYAPFVPFANFFPLIYSVWRLDAATPALAQGLIDKALLAESAGLSGQVCIDEWFLSPTYDYGLAGIPDWNLRQAATFAREAGFTVTQDFNSVEFGTSPAPLRCDNAAFYAGGGHIIGGYNDAFSWSPGAIGFHLDSESAYNPRGGPTWSPNALIRGITVTSGAVSEPYIQGLPHADGILRNLFEGANVGDAFMRNTMWLK